MAKDKGFLTEVSQEVAAQLREMSEFLKEFNTTPIGKVRLSPRQVRQLYGMGLREIQELEKIHGEDTIAELLAQLQATGGLDNAQL